MKCGECGWSEARCRELGWVLCCGGCTHVQRQPLPSRIAG